MAEERRGGGAEERPAVRPLVFVRDDAGGLTVQEWLPRMLISPEFLADAPEIETMIIVKAGGHVRRYRVVECTPGPALIAEDLGGADADG